MGLRRKRCWMSPKQCVYVDRAPMLIVEGILQKRVHIVIRDSVLNASVHCSGWAHQGCAAVKYSIAAIRDNR